jgi:glycine oxidase
MNYDVIIIGGGVIGCSIAHYLSERGASVAVVERHTLGAEASGAAAGLLGVQAEWTMYDSLFQAARKSRSMFPALSVKLRDKTGIDIGYQSSGIYRIACNEETAQQLRESVLWQQNLGEQAVIMTGEQLRDKEPAISPFVHEAVYYPEDGHVIAHELTRAFAYSAAASGATIYEETEVLEIERSGNTITGVVTSRGRISCAQVVVAAGSWSTPFLHMQHVGTYPVKGEVLSVTSYKSILSVPIFEEGFYIVPKRGGRYIIGATVTEGVYDKTVTMGGIQSLMQKAVAILPALQEAKWERAWAGLRPQSKAGAPYMGRHPEIEGLYMCTGHYRNGILLSPLAGRYMADLLEGKSVREEGFVCY